MILCSVVSKQFNTISKKEILWCQFVERINDDIDWQLLNKKSYYDKYVKYSQLKNLNNHFELNYTINALINLQKLDLSNNQITTIPLEISALINLQALYLENNQITTLKL